AQVREDLLGLLRDAAGDELLRARLERELARHEHEAVRLVRLRVRRSLERRGGRFRPDHLPSHCSPPYAGLHAWPIAAPSALKIASSTCSVSFPSSSRTWTLRPAALASSSRKRAPTWVASPPTRWPEKSTLAATSGRSATSTTTPASASSDGKVAQPRPHAPPDRSGSPSAAPSARPAAST